MSHADFRPCAERGGFDKSARHACGDPPKAWHPTHGPERRKHVAVMSAVTAQNVREVAEPMILDRDPGLGFPSRWADGIVLALFAAVSFCLGCYEMGDSDLWWHLSGGRWIIAHRQVPDLDPF